MELEPGIHVGGEIGRGRGEKILFIYVLAIEQCSKSAVFYFTINMDVYEVRNGNTRGWFRKFMNG